MAAPTATKSIGGPGGGYAGILCANRLRSSLSADEAGRVRITLVNPTDQDTGPRRARSAGMLDR